MSRFFIDDQALDGDLITITGQDVRHIRLVLRLEPGDPLTLVDPGGQEYQAVVVLVEHDRVEARVVAQGLGAGEPPLPVTLIQGLPKGDKLELVIRMSTELGATRVIPVAACRSVARPAEDRAGRRLERWRRVAVEAAKQCGRSAVPEVSPLVGLAAALAAVRPGGLVLLPWEEETGVGMKQVIRELPAVPPEVAVLIGPEGGWTQEEVDLATRMGAVAVSLGPRILRTETAGVAAVAMVLYELGDLGGPGTRYLE